MPKKPKFKAISPNGTPRTKPTEPPGWIKIDLEEESDGGLDFNDKTLSPEQRNWLITREKLCEEMAESLGIDPKLLHLYFGTDREILAADPNTIMPHKGTLNEEITMEKCDGCHKEAYLVVLNGMKFCRKCTTILNKDYMDTFDEDE